jgi:hypothetical protein
MPATAISQEERTLKKPKFIRPLEIRSYNSLAFSVSYSKRIPPRLPPRIKIAPSLGPLRFWMPPTNQYLIKTVFVALNQCLFN